MDFIQPVIDWFVSCILILPQIVFWAGQELLVVVIAALPDVPVMDPSTLNSGFSGDLLYFLTLMKFDYGMTAVVGALIARFTLRRVPFIG